MVIEISLTRKLCDKLGLTLLPLENNCPKENHFYADIITKDRQQNIMFFNTLFSWVSISKFKDFKKCPLQENSVLKNIMFCCLSLVMISA